MNVLQVEIPQSHRRDVDQIWSHMQEDPLDSDTLLRLRRNGLRVGLGRTEWWDAIRETIGAIDGRRVTQIPVMRMPQGFLLSLELDTEPHDQTLFHVESDGVLTGSSWPQSRNVLTLSYTFDARDPQRVHLRVLPEVRQRLPGWQWIRTDAGVWQGPKLNNKPFPTAGFTLAIDPGQFVLVAPSESADLYGMIGGAFLTNTTDGARYDCYVFLTPDVGHDGRSDK